MNKIIVFGGDGFIGRHLVDRLSESENNRITVFSRFSSYQIDDEHHFKDLNNVRIVVGNFFNRSDVSNALSDVDYVFHLISTTNPATSMDDPLIDIETNIKSSVDLLELCVEKKVKRVLFLSSGGAIYGDVNSSEINELSLPQPKSPYAIGKLTIEHYLRYFKSHHALDYIVYRVANPYGPGQNLHGKQGVIPIFLSHIYKKEPITVLGDGEMIRDYLYISDLIDMLTASYDKSHKFNEYNIGSGKGASINELIQIIERVIEYEVNKKYANIPDTYVRKIVLSIDRFVSEFEQKPKVSLEEGILRTWDYVREKQ